MKYNTNLLPTYIFCLELLNYAYFCKYRNFIIRLDIARWWQQAGLWLHVRKSRFVRFAEICKAYAKKVISWKMIRNLIISPFCYGLLRKNLKNYLFTNIQMKFIAIIITITAIG